MKTDATVVLFVVAVVVACGAVFSSAQTASVTQIFGSESGGSFGVSVASSGSLLAVGVPFSPPWYNYELFGGYGVYAERYSDEEYYFPKQEDTWPWGYVYLYVCSQTPGTGSCVYKTSVTYSVTPAPTALPYSFGLSVGFSGNGTVLFVGAPGLTLGFAYNLTNFLSSGGSAAIPTPTTIATLLGNIVVNNGAYAHVSSAGASVATLPGFVSSSAWAVFGSPVYTNNVSPSVQTIGGFSVCAYGTAIANTGSVAVDIVTRTSTKYNGNAVAISALNATSVIVAGADLGGSGTSSSITVVTCSLRTTKIIACLNPITNVTTAGSGWNNTIALTSTFLVAGNPITQQVYVYTLVLNPASAFLGTLTILDGSSLGSLFGLAVAVTGSTVAVVAPASQSVVTYTCTTSGSSTACTQSFILTSSLAPTYSFGSSFAINDGLGYVVIGASQVEEQLGEIILFGCNGVGNLVSCTTAAQNPAVTTSIPPTASATASSTVTATDSATATFTDSATATFTGSATATFTDSATATFTDSATATFTDSATATFTESATHSATASFTESITVSATASFTESATHSATASFTESVTVSATASFTESATASFTESATASFTESATASSTLTQSALASSTESAVASSTESATQVKTTTPLGTTIASAAATPLSSATWTATAFQPAAAATPSSTATMATTTTILMEATALPATATFTIPSAASISVTASKSETASALATETTATAATSPASAATPVASSTVSASAIRQSTAPSTPSPTAAASPSSNHGGVMMLHTATPSPTPFVLGTMQASSASSSVIAGAVVGVMAAVSLAAVFAFILIRRTSPSKFAHKLMQSLPPSLRQPEADSVEMHEFSI